MPKKIRGGSRWSKKRIPRIPLSDSGATPEVAAFVPEPAPVLIEPSAKDATALEAPPMKKKKEDFPPLPPLGGSPPSPALFTVNLPIQTDFVSVGPAPVVDASSSQAKNKNSPKTRKLQEQRQKKKEMENRNKEILRKERALQSPRKIPTGEPQIQAPVRRSLRLSSRSSTEDDEKAPSSKRKRGRRSPRSRAKEDLFPSVAEKKAPRIQILQDLLITPANALCTRKEILPLGGPHHFGVITRANRHQGDFRYSDLSRGNQCTAMAAFALSFLEAVSSTPWDSSVLDFILDSGDALYRYSMQTRPAPPPGVHAIFLNVMEVAPRFIFRYQGEDYGVIFNYPQLTAFERDQQGDRGLLMNEPPAHNYSADQQLAHFFAHHDVGILIGAAQTVALWKLDGSYYLFDSHSRPIGNGAAFLMRCRNIEELSHNLRGIFESASGDFQIHHVSVSSTRDFLQWDNRLRLQPVNDTPGVTRTLRNRVVRSPSPSIQKNRKGVSRRTSFAENESALARASQDSIDEILDYLPALLDEFVLEDAVNLENVEEHRLKPMVRKCNHCLAYKYEEESYVSCCKSGAVRLPAIHQRFPEYLKKLFLGEHPLSKEFFKNARGHNNQLSMATTQANFSHVAGVFNPCVALEGTLYHLVNEVDIQRSNTAAFYYVDFENMKEHMDPNRAVPVSEVIIRDVRQILLDIGNPFVQIYEQMGNLRRQNPNIENYHIKFHLKSNVNRSTHNKPTNLNEVGAVFVSEQGDEMPPPGEFRVYEKTAGQGMRSKIISATAPITDPLAFPFLFPEGEFGWEVDIIRYNQKARKRVSFREYWAHRLQVREKRNYLLEAGKLTQAFFLSVWIRIEDDRCNYLKGYQSKLRVSDYAGLIDYVHRKNEDLAQTRGEAVPKVGKMTVLPSTFVGGRRYMQAKFQDAMTIVSKFGKPTYFLTLTTNPQWPEIQEFIRNNGHKNVQDRPDITARVFYAKSLELMRYLLSNESILGKVTAYVLAYEFQKRGLPHAHILLTTTEFDRPHNGDDVDRIISAEIPDPDTNPKLHALVARTMMHNPCGKDYPDGVCMVDGKCSKNFPRYNSNVTTISNDGKVRYRRRKDDRTVQVRTSRGNKTAPLDNRFVVEYCPYLLMRFNCHFNVQVVTEYTAPKYLFKYITKGQDMATITVENEDGSFDVNEVKEYIETRYVTSGCAAWRLLEFPLVKMSHTVERLPVHLPNEQYVMFEEGDESNAAVRAETRNSKLMAFFELNKKSEHARQLTYNQIPEHYRFVGKNWIKRMKCTKIVSRIYTISPRETEKFHLRILLLHVTGPTSFEDLLTVNGHKCATFEESARLRNLILDDEVWEKTLRDAEVFQMPGQMRKLFGNLLCFCNVRNGPELFEKFKVALSADYVHRGMQQEEAERRALLRIAGHLRYLHRDLADFNFQVDIQPQDMVFDDEVAPYHVDVNDGQIIRATEKAEEVDRNYMQLNPEQKALYDAVVRAVKDEGLQHRYFYLQGCGGTGKTFVYNAILQYLDTQNIPALPVAFTGIAALLLHGGQTAHSAFGIPIQVDKDMRSWIAAHSPKADYLRSIKLIVWDEISMVSQFIINCVDTLLRDVRNDRRPFGGVCTLFGGDIRQLLCVAPDKVDQIEQVFFKCRCWGSFEIYEFKQNMRTDPGEKEFSNWLLKVGSGKINQEGSLFIPKDSMVVPKECLTDDAVASVYGSLDMTVYRPQLSEALSDCAVLCPLNENCDRINRQMLDRFPGETHNFLSVDTIDSDDKEEQAMYQEETLNGFNLPNLPLHKLELKIGVPVMLLRNISVRDGLTNGTRMIVKHLKNNVLVCEILTGRFRGNQAFISRHDLTAKPASLPFTIKRRQFPVKVCFALTINKAQGQTFEKVGVYLPKPVFSHGQLYVALSRVRSQHNLKLQIVSGRAQGNLMATSADVHTRNVVFKEIFKYIWPNGNQD